MALNIPGMQVPIEPIQRAHQGKALRMAQQMDRRESDSRLKTAALQQQKMEMETSEAQRTIAARDAYNNAKTPQDHLAVSKQFPEYYTQRKEVETKMALEHFTASQEILSTIDSAEDWERAFPALEKVMPGISKKYDPEAVLSARDVQDTVIRDLQSIEILNAAGHHDMALQLEGVVQQRARTARVESEAREAQARAQELQAQAAMMRATTDAADAASGGGREIESADSSLIYRIAAGRYGGIIDEAGNLKLLDPSVQPKILELSTKASQIYRDYPGVTHSEAVSLAERELSGAGSATTPQAAQMVQFARQAIADPSTSPERAAEIKQTILNDYGIDLDEIEE